MRENQAQLAIYGGRPVRASLLPYGLHHLEDDDVKAVVSVLRSAWLTTGPKIEEFEQRFASFVGTKEAVAVNSGTAALHAAMHAIGVGPGDEVIVPALTFVATANSVIFQGAKPVFVDVNPETLLIDPLAVEEKITDRTKAIVAVDYAGQPCDYDSLRYIARKYNLGLIADACHSLGGKYKGRSVGSLADLSTFSFHPVKHITTGEGGMITTDDAKLAQRMRVFRNHGITTEFRQREQRGTWLYEMVDLGYNYRITDFQCALGMSQLRKLPDLVARRQEIARSYDAALSEIPAISSLNKSKEVDHAYHLYVIRLDLSKLQVSRKDIYIALRAEGIGVNVHYLPVYLHPFYIEKFGTGPGLCPVAEAAYEQILSIPIYPKMTRTDVDDVVCGLTKVISAFLRL
ncbi:UDP-4-amino-4,6-dideoxy-N-acetyl-beta-L-altrosamine transaminase [Thermogemmatispora sp.]|uniref:UDP-4-amino-4, 6-dideoxy-N-acetyl-beta-L-altrosamine transaminase n=1 Tax=Thermogemmatispora sp. TaxID=1968838 RepID=UPI0035E40E4B